MTKWYNTILFIMAIEKKGEKNYDNLYDFVIVL